MLRRVGAQMSLGVVGVVGDGFHVVARLVAEFVRGQALRDVEPVRARPAWGLLGFRGQRWSSGLTPNHV